METAIVVDKEVGQELGGVTQIVFQHNAQGQEPRSNEEKNEVIPINELRWRMAQLTSPTIEVACARVLGPIFNGCQKTTGHTKTSVAIANSIINRVA